MLDLWIGKGHNYGDDSRRSLYFLQAGIIEWLYFRESQAQKLMVECENHSPGKSADSRMLSNYTADAAENGILK